MSVALHPDTIRLFDYASGVGMLSEGVRIALDCIGVRAECVGYCERESHAAATLVARMEAQALHPAPIWSDATTFDGAAWRGCVDGFVSGFPCQPYSLAGKRRGSGDARDLWPYVHRTIEAIRPSFVFLENVGGLLSAGYERVVEGLEDCGFAVAAGLFTAEEVGAPHRRERLFILGVANAEHDGRGIEVAGWGPDRRGTSGGPGGELADDTGERRAGDAQSHEWPEQSELGASRRGNAGRRDHDVGDAGGAGFEGESCGAGEKRWHEPTGSTGQAGGKLADAAGVRRRQRIGQRERETSEGRSLSWAEGCGDELADSELDRLKSRDDIDAKLGSPQRGDELPIFAPGRNDFDAWRRVAELDPSLMPAIESEIRGLAHGMAPMADELRAIGNGVCPMAAAFAFLSLWSGLRGGEL